MQVKDNNTKNIINLMYEYPQVDLLFLYFIMVFEVPSSPWMCLVFWALGWDIHNYIYHIDEAFPYFFFVNITFQPN